MKKVRKKTYKPKALTFAIYTQNGKLLFKKEFLPNTVTQYLNENASRGKSYMAVALNGSSRKVPKELIKEFEKKIEKATLYLYPKDIANLKALLKILKERPAKEGMIKAAQFETIVRDAIPLEIWEAMGGEITHD